MPPVGPLTDLKEEILRTSEQLIGLPDNLHLLCHIAQPPGAVETVVTAALNEQRAGRDETRDIPHIYVFPEMGHIIAGAVVV